MTLGLDRFTFHARPIQQKNLGADVTSRGVLGSHVVQVEPHYNRISFSGFAGSPQCNACIVPSVGLIGKRKRWLVIGCKGSIQSSHMRA